MCEGEECDGDEDEGGVPGDQSADQVAVNCAHHSREYGYVPDLSPMFDLSVFVNHCYKCYGFLDISKSQRKHDFLIFELCTLQIEIKILDSILAFV